MLQELNTIHWSERLKVFCLPYENPYEEKDNKITCFYSANRYFYTPKEDLTPIQTPKFILDYWVWSLEGYLKRCKEGTARLLAKSAKQDAKQDLRTQIRGL